MIMRMRGIDNHSIILSFVYNPLFFVVHPNQARMELR